ncbi:MAG: hypothetical protein GXY05_10990 [Clostridiales bacterium]|nr:hypothetical protein [Clostridiales bacterium]
MPESVRMATSEYRQASDKIGLFIEDCMNVDGTSEVRTAMVYTEYRVWCAENGYYAESIRNFNASLGAKLSIVRKRPSPRESVTTVIIGARLLTGFERS